jgi:hypothetical protein
MAQMAAQAFLPISQVQQSLALVVAAAVAFLRVELVALAAVVTGAAVVVLAAMEPPILVVVVAVVLAPLETAAQAALVL